MADELNKTPKQVRNYGNNSDRVKKAKPDEPEEPRTKFQIQGTAKQKQPGLGRKFKETFGGEKADNVLQYVVLEVILPATKNLIFDVVREGAARMLFGGAAPRRTSSGVNIVGGRTNYSSMGNGQAIVIGNNGQRELSSSARAMHDFKDIILDQKAEADEVLEELNLLIEQFDVATVADLYSCLRISGAHTDNKYGWTNLAGASVQQVREGWWLDLPRPILLS